MDETTSALLEMFFNLLFTGLFYCAIPIIIRLAKKKPMDRMKATKVALLNAIIILVLFFIIYYFIYVTTEELRTPNFSAAIIWFFPSWAILRFGHKKASTIDVGASSQTNPAILTTDHTNQTENPSKNIEVQKQQNGKYCTKCGSLNRIDNVYCRVCGSKLSES